MQSLFETKSPCTKQSSGFGSQKEEKKLYTTIHFVFCNSWNFPRDSSQGTEPDKLSDPQASDIF